jgi:hypothetical protein
LDGSSTSHSDILGRGLLRNKLRSPPHTHRLLHRHRIWCCHHRPPLCFVQTLAAFLSHFDSLAGWCRCRNQVIATQPPCDSVAQNRNRRPTRFPRASVDFPSSNNPVAAHPLLPSPKSGHSSLIATSFARSKIKPPTTKIHPPIPPSTFGHLSVPLAYLLTSFVLKVFDKLTRLVSLYIFILFYFLNST